MKLLYVTPLWSGLEDILCRGVPEARGMPAFIEPLRRLVEQGHDVDLAIVKRKKYPLNVGPAWLKRCVVHWLDQWPPNRVVALFILLRRNRYDFVYAHSGGRAIWANLAAMLTGTPCGARFYGTFMGMELERTRLSLFWSNPLEFIAYNLPKAFLLTTNDGTRGDAVWRKCCFLPHLYDFHFWLNGSDSVGVTPCFHEEPGVDIEQFGIPDGAPWLFYPARYHSWKRQDLALEMVEALKDAGETRIHLLCCGHVYDQPYYERLQEKARQLGVSERVHLMGPLPRTDVRRLHSQALASLSLYDVSNLGNALIEGVCAGALMICRRDGTTDFLVRHRETGFLIDTPGDGARVIGELMENPSSREEMVRQAMALASARIETWDRRAEREIELIQKAVDRGGIDPKRKRRSVT